MPVSTLSVLFFLVPLGLTPSMKDDAAVDETGIIDIRSGLRRLLTNSDSERMRNFSSIVVIGLSRHRATCVSYLASLLARVPPLPSSCGGGASRAPTHHSPRTGEKISVVAVYEEGMDVHLYVSAQGTPK